jgi:hypothetical protein
MTTPQQQDPTADQFLMGGGGAATAKFPTIGTSVSGRITERPVVEQQRDIKDGSLKFWSDGGKMMQLVVTVQTDQRDPEIEDDDGKRRIFVKGVMKNAIADAVRSVGGKGLEVGGTLTVTYTHDGVAKQRGFDPPKQYSAFYVPAATNALHTPDPGTAQQYAAPQAQQYQAPAPQYAVPAPVASVPGLTPEQLQAAMANPATAALLAQQQAAAAAGHTQQPMTPGAPAAPGDVPAF